MTIFRFQFRSSNRVGSGISTPKRGGTRFSCGGLEPTSSTQSKSVEVLSMHRKNMPQRFTIIRESINTNRKSSQLRESAKVFSGGIKKERRVAASGKSMPG